MQKLQSYVTTVVVLVLVLMLVVGLGFGFFVWTFAAGDHLPLVQDIMLPNTPPFHVYHFNVEQPT